VLGFAHTIGEFGVVLMIGGNIPGETRVASIAIAAHDEHYQLTHLEFAGGRLTMTRIDLPPGNPVRLSLAARDVSLTLEHHSGTSILNILPLTVDAVKSAGGAQVTVRMMAAGVPILARITRKSAEELCLESGKSVFAQIKSIALLT
jgi:molybdate transport system ATP-binding protein